MTEDYPELNSNKGAAMDRRRVVIALLAGAGLRPALAHAQTLNEFSSSYSAQFDTISEVAIWAMTKLAEVAGEPVNQESDAWKIDMIAPYAAVEAARAVAGNLIPPMYFQRSHDLYVRFLDNLIQSGIHNRNAILSSDPAVVEFELGRARARFERGQDFLERATAAIPSSAMDLDDGETPDSSNAGAAIEVEGNGDQVTDAFTLDAGRYRATALVHVGDEYDLFLAYFHSPDGDEDMIFSEYIEGPTVWTGSAFVEIEVGGGCFIEVTGTNANWTIALAPIDASFEE